MLLTWIFGVLAVLGCCLTLWQWRVARQFPLHQRSQKRDFLPPLTLLKPLKGCDAETEECLRSWFAQDYSPPLQILFGVASAEDPVCQLVEKLIAEHPHTCAQLILCTDLLGPNAKVSTLAQLESHAKHATVVVSDADVRVEKDFLANAIQPMRESQIGLVNCFYRLANPTTVAMHCEAIAINADFWSQVLQSKSLRPLNFALGAVMILRRDTLNEIGGFLSLVNHLADDYQLGNQIARSGQPIVLATVVAECWESPLTWRQVWNHQLRWARTIRGCQPLPFFFSILSNATLWLLLWTGTLFALQHPYWFVPVSILLPIRIQAALKMQEWLNRSSNHYPWFWLVPVKDLLHAGIWAMAFAGNSIEWRGEKFRVLRNGKLERI